MSPNVVNGPYESRLGGLTREVFVLATLAVLLSFGKAFNSGVLDWPLRTVFWLVCAFAIIGQLALIWRRVLSRIMPETLAFRLLGCATASVLVAAAFSAELNLLKLTPLSPVAPASWLRQFHWLLPPIVVMGLAYALFGRFRRRQAKPSFVELPAPLPQLALPAPPRLLAGSSPRADAPNWPKETPCWIHAQDHYLELGGVKRFVRARLRDAVRHYDGGLQVHRSWWVRIDAVQRLERRGRDLWIVMTDGQHIPISRRNQASVRRVCNFACPSSG